MRRFLAILLLSCLIAPFVGSYLWMEIKKKSIRKEVKWKMIAGLDQNELVSFTFSKVETQSKLKWKHSKEFEYKGQMYDVVNAIDLGDSILYHLWWDHEETALNNQLKQLIVLTVENSPINKNTKGSVSKLLHSLFVEQQFVVTFNPILIDNFYENTAFQPSRYRSILLAIDFPPPEFS